MHAIIVVSVLGALASAVSAGSVFLDNRCNQRVFVNSNANQDPPSDGIILFPGSTYSEIQRGPNLGNNTIRVSTDGNLDTGLIFGYAQNIVTGRLYYSFDVSRGDPFRALGYEVITNGGHLGVLCPPSSVACPYSRHNFSAEPVYNVANGADFTVRVCQYDGPP